MPFLPFETFSLSHTHETTSASVLGPDAFVVVIIKTLQVDIVLSFLFMYQIMSQNWDMIWVEH